MRASWENEGGRAKGNWVSIRGDSRLTALPGNQEQKTLDLDLDARNLVSSYEKLWFEVKKKCQNYFQLFGMEELSNYQRTEKSQYFSKLKMHYN